MFGSPETTPGGRALKFYSSVRLDMRRIETLKEGVEAIGNRVRVKVVKNKVAPPFKQAEFDVIYGEGISWEGSVLDVGLERKLVQKSGSYFSFGDERLGQGRQNATAFLQGAPRRHRRDPPRRPGRARARRGRLLAPAPGERRREGRRRRGAGETVEAAAAAAAWVAGMHGEGPRRRSRPSAGAGRAAWRSRSTDVPGASSRTTSSSAAGSAAGVELDRPLLRDLRRELRRSEALATAVRTVSRRDISAVRLRRASGRAASPRPEAEAAVETLSAAGVVDDDRLARSRARALARNGGGEMLRWRRASHRKGFPLAGRHGRARRDPAERPGVPPSSERGHPTAAPSGACSRGEGSRRRPSRTSWAAGRDR